MDNYNWEENIQLGWNTFYSFSIVPKSTTNKNDVAGTQISEVSADHKTGNKKLDTSELKHQILIKHYFLPQDFVAHEYKAVEKNRDCHFIWSLGRRINACSVSDGQDVDASFLYWFWWHFVKKH